MSGAHFQEPDRWPGTCLQKALAGIVNLIIASCILSSSSGCAIKRATLLQSTTAAAPGVGLSRYSSAHGHVSPNCAVPQYVVSQQADETTHSSSGIAGIEPAPPSLMETTTAQVPVAELQTKPLVPLPDQQLSSLPGLPAQPVPQVPASVEELSQCQNQLAEMNQQVSSLKRTTERAQQAMELMAAEQLKLQQQNESLLRRAERTDRQYLESMESLSQIISEVITPSDETLKPAPASTASPQTAEQNLPAIPQSSLDESQ